jgi:hypothetical protein
MGTPAVKTVSNTPPCILPWATFDFMVNGGEKKKEATKMGM